MSEADTRASFLCIVETEKLVKSWEQLTKSSANIAERSFSTASACYGLYQECIGCGSSVVETDLPIRCPACLHVLNRTEQEFNEQVQIVMMWD